MSGAVLCYYTMHHIHTHPYMLTAANADDAQECEDIYTELHSITGKRMPIKGEEAFTVEVVKFNKDDKTSKSMVQSAYKLFRGSFGGGWLCCMAHAGPAVTLFHQLRTACAAGCTFIARLSTVVLQIFH